MTVEPIRKAGADDAVAMSATLAAAFYADPFFRWMLPDDGRREATLRGFFTLVLDLLAVHDDAWTTADGTTGTALWVPYGHEAISEQDAERFTAEVRKLAGPDADRMLSLFALADEHHPTDPHEYLFFIGVRPEFQRRGIGRALSAPVLERADAAGHPCYLEASSDGSRALYEQLGFRAIAAITPAGGPTFWPMVRPVLSA